MVFYQHFMMIKSLRFLKHRGKMLAVINKSLGFPQGIYTFDTLISDFL